VSEAPQLPAIRLADLRAALEAAGAPPRRRHGQHFLQDGNLLAAIVRDAGVVAGDTVLEIGPGPGLLTRHLLATGARVVAVEIDPRVRVAAGMLIEPHLAERLEWQEADALSGPKTLSPRLREVLPRCTRVVANLPYNIAATLVVGLLREPSAPESQVVMVQREVGERLLAAPGSRDYGALSVLTALSATGQVLRSVPPAAFWPPPRVQSVVLRLTRRPDRPPEESLRALEAFLALAFHGRRKILLNSVASAAGLTAAEVARRLGLDEQEKRRAEAFTSLQLFDLAQAWASTAPSGLNRS
jgi:16S rRNA (adenine1518-N6/adenine1519-N6)-dimethyltransferase